MERKDIITASVAFAAGIGLATAVLKRKYCPPAIWQNKVATGKFGAINAPTAGARLTKALPKVTKFMV